MQTQTLSIDEAAELLGIGRDAVRAGISAGQIPAIKVGKHIRVAGPALQAMLNGDTRPDESAIARQVHLMSLKSTLDQLETQAAEISRQIAEIESVDTNGLVAYVSGARSRRKSA